jgi:hypothetical protein
MNEKERLIRQEIEDVLKAEDPVGAERHAGELHDLLGAASVTPLSPERLESLLTQTQAQLRPRAIPTYAWIVATSSAFLVMALLISSQALMVVPVDTWTAMLALLAAIFLGAIAKKNAAFSLFGSIATAIILVILQPGNSGLHAHALSECMGLEMITAFVPAVIAVGGAWGRVKYGPAGLAAVAAAGAVAGEAGLHLMCGGPEAMSHRLMSHLGGVLLAALVGAVLERPLTGVVIRLRESLLKVA